MEPLVGNFMTRRLQGAEIKRISRGRDTGSDWLVDAQLAELRWGGMQKCKLHGEAIVQGLRNFDKAPTINLIILFIIAPAIAVGRRMPPSVNTYGTETRAGWVSIEKWKWGLQLRNKNKSFSRNPESRIFPIRIARTLGSH